ncbi:MAG: esterase-like activity of phytase family protein [Nibricoccus sp.]
MKIPGITPLLAAAGALIASTASLEAQLNTSTGIVTGTNRIAVPGATSVSLNGVSFVNQGLVGVGSLSALATDAWGESLGSVSGLQIGNFTSTGNGSYTGSFYTLPDRGYNAGTTFSNYAARIQEVDFTFTPYYGAATTSANQIALSYNATGSTKLTYNNGSGFVTTTGLVPDSSTMLAAKTVPYVTISNGSPGVPTSGGTTINRLSLDSEGLVLKKDGSGYVSDEYAAAIYHFNSAKQIDAVITPPAAIQPHSPAGTLAFSSEISNVNGRRGNQGMEGVALSPDGTKLFGLMQSATLQDSGSGNQGRLYTRLLVYDVSGNIAPDAPVAEYVLKLPVLNDTGSGNPNKTAAQSEIVAIDNTHILVLARDGNGLGATSSGQPVFKSVLLVDLAAATNIAGTLYDLEGGDITPGNGTTLAPGITTLSWAEAVNMLNETQLAKFGLNLKAGSAADLNTLSEKWEGMSLVSAQDPLAPNDYFLFLANDNDFLSSNTLMAGLDGKLLAGVDTGVTNNTTFLAYRVTITPVPEPSTFMTIGVALSLGVIFFRRRKR